MRRVVLSVAVSLDGYIADPQGGYDWIVMDPEIDFDAMFKRYDAVLMGRKSYDAAKQSGYGMPKPQTYVFSKTLQQADAPDVTVSNDPQKTVTALKKQKGKDIWLWGGGSCSGACSSWAWSISWRSQSFRCCWGTGCRCCRGRARARSSS